MRFGDWISDVCSSDRLVRTTRLQFAAEQSTRDGMAALPRQSHDADDAVAGGRGDRGDRIDHVFAGAFAGDSPYLRTINHCCNRPRPPLVTQYSTRPAGQHATITPIATGMYCIILS